MYPFTDSPDSMLAVRIDLNLKTMLWEAIPFKSGTSSRLVIEYDDRYG